MVECSRVCRAQHDNQSWCKFQDDVSAAVASQKPCHLSTSVVPTEGGARVVHALLWRRRRPFVWHLRQVADIVFGLAISISWVTPMARAAWLGRSWGGLGQREFDLNASWEQEAFVFLELLAQQAIWILDCLNPLQPALICTKPLVTCSNLSFLHIDGGHQKYSPEMFTKCPWAANRFTWKEPQMRSWPTPLCSRNTVPRMTACKRQECLNILSLTRLVYFLA